MKTTTTDSPSDAIKQRIEMYEQRAQTLKRRYAQDAAMMISYGLREALCILDGEDLNSLPWIDGGE